MRRIVSAVIVAAVLAVGGLAYAEAQPADPSVQSLRGEPGPRTTPRATQTRPGRNLLREAFHGELLVRDGESPGSTRTIVFDRGTLTSISESSVTLERPDGVLVSARVTPETRFNGTSQSDLQPGAAVLVVHSAGTAERVVGKGVRSEERPAPAAGPRRERLRSAGR